MFLEWNEDGLMKAQLIRVVVGDRGGWAAVESPLGRALDEGCDVRVLLTASCRALYEAGKLSMDSRIMAHCGDSEIESVSSFLAGYYDLLVVGASQSAEGAEAALNAVMVASSPVIAVQDYYGSFMPTLRALRAVRGLGNLDRLCVHDHWSRRMILQGYNLDHCVITTGGPQFDKVVKMKESWHICRSRLRPALGMTDYHKVFLVVGQINGTAEVLELLEQGIDSAGLASIAKVIVRTHPRATDDDRRMLDAYMRRASRTWFVEVDSGLAQASEGLLPVADAVLSGYSTVNYFGVLCEMPGVMYVGTPALKADLRYEKGRDVPVEAELGAAWYVTSADDMEHAIRAVCLPEKYGPCLEREEIARTQREIAMSNDGSAAERVWGEMQKLMAR